MAEHVLVSMTRDEADARALGSVWSALVCWRNYHPETRAQVDALLSGLSAHTITARDASSALFDIQYAHYNRA